MLGYLSTNHICGNIVIYLSTIERLHYFITVSKWAKAGSTSWPIGVSTTYDKIVDQEARVIICKGNRRFKAILILLLNTSCYLALQWVVKYYYLNTSCYLALQWIVKYYYLNTSCYLALQWIVKYYYLNTSCYLALQWVIESLKKLHNCTFPTATTANQSNCLTDVNFQVKTL